MYFMFFLMLEGSYNWNSCYYSDGMEGWREISGFFVQFIFSTFFTFQGEIQQVIQNSKALLLLCKYVQKDSGVCFYLP